MAVQFHRVWLLLVVGALLLASNLPAAATTQVTYCGQVYMGRGILTGNLDCTGYGGHALIIERGSLELNGFTLTGGDYYGVHCLTTCWIKGPGTIQGAGWDGVRADGWTVAYGVVIRDNGLNGINGRNNSNASRLIVRDSTITGNGFNGIEADSAVLVRRSTITNNGAYGIDVGVQFCDTAGRVLLQRSTVTGNGGACPDGMVCADVSSCGRRNHPPRLRRTTCGTSYQRESGIPGLDWDVCQQD